MQAVDGSVYIYIYVGVSKYCCRVYVEPNLIGVGVGDTLFINYLFLPCLKLGKNIYFEGMFGRTADVSRFRFFGVLLSPPACRTEY